MGSWEKGRKAPLSNFGRTYARTLALAWRKILIIANRLAYSITYSVSFWLQSGTAEELEANLEMSSLVNYIQPARFHTFDNAESELHE